MMKRKQREKFSYGVAVGVVAFSSITTVGAMGILALEKLKSLFKERQIPLLKLSSMKGHGKIYWTNWKMKNAKSTKFALIIKIK